MLVGEEERPMIVIRVYEWTIIRHSVIKVVGWIRTKEPNDDQITRGYL